MSDTTHPAGEPMGANDTRAPATVAPDPVPASPEPVAPIPEPGDTLSNPAEPLAPTKLAERAKAEAFITPNVAPAGYPKMMYHPVHGGIEVADPNAMAGLLPSTDWFDSPEKADAARTWTEAHMASAHNTREKLAAHDDAGHAIVRNSVQADEAIRRGLAEPL